MIKTFDNQLPFPSSQFQTRPFWCLVGSKQEQHWENSVWLLLDSCLSVDRLFGRPDCKMRCIAARVDQAFQYPLASLCWLPRACRGLLLLLMQSMKIRLSFAYWRISLIYLVPLSFSPTHYHTGLAADPACVVFAAWPRAQDFATFDSAHVWIEQRACSSESPAEFHIDMGNGKAAIILRGLPNKKYLSHFRWHVVDKCDCGGCILSKCLLVCPVNVLHLILDRFRWCRLASWLSTAHLYWQHCMASFAAGTGRFYWVTRMLWQVTKLCSLLPGLRWKVGRAFFWTSVKLWFLLKVIAQGIPVVLEMLL